jgi:hypothetical protein
VIRVTLAGRRPGAAVLVDLDALWIGNPGPAGNGRTDYDYRFGPPGEAREPIGSRAGHPAGDHRIAYLKCRKCGRSDSFYHLESVPTKFYLHGLKRVSGEIDATDFTGDDDRTDEQSGDEPTYHCGNCGAWSTDPGELVNWR